MNEENLPTPQEPPQVPRGKLWTSMLVPPVMTGLLTAALASGSKNNYGSDALIVLPIGLVVIIGCLFPYLACLKARYRGRSVTLMGFGFFIGQVVICLGIWFGTCLLIV